MSNEPEMRRSYLNVDTHKRYGKLRPLYEIPERSIRKHKKAGDRPHIMWLFRCECGKVTLHEAYRVLNGSIKSCGCGRRSKNPLETEVKDLYSRYVHAAYARGYTFSLELSDFKDIVTKNCYYCNTPPRPVLRRKRVNHPPQRLNGIDRKDNEIGYTKRNSVPCCPTCNMMKGKLKAKEFVKRAKKIHDNFTK